MSKRASLRTMTATKLLTFLETLDSRVVEMGPKCLRLVDEEVQSSYSIVYYVFFF